MKLRRRRKIKPIKETAPISRGTSEKAIARALLASGGMQSPAAAMLRVSQSAISQRISKSPFLQEIVAEIKAELIDIAETKLKEHILAGNLTACIFYLKTVGKERGYNEKSELDINANVRGGVLVVPAPMTPEAWVAEGQRIAEVKKQKQLTGGTDDEESNLKNRARPVRSYQRHEGLKRRIDSTVEGAEPHRGSNNKFEITHSKTPDFEAQS